MLAWHRPSMSYTGVVFNGVVNGVSRAGSHYNLGTSRGPDKIGSRPAGRVLHVVGLNIPVDQSHQFGQNKEWNNLKDRDRRWEKYPREVSDQSPTLCRLRFLQCVGSYSHSVCYRLLRNIVAPIAIRCATDYYGQFRLLQPFGVLQTTTEYWGSYSHSVCYSSLAHRMAEAP